MSECEILLGGTTCFSSICLLPHYQQEQMPPKQSAGRVHIQPAHTKDSKRGRDAAQVCFCYSWSLYSSVMVVQEWWWHTAHVLLQHESQERSWRGEATILRTHTAVRAGRAAKSKKGRMFHLSLCDPNYLCPQPGKRHIKTRASRLLN